MTVGDRTWVRIRFCGFSYPNPNTVTYGQPKKHCFLDNFVTSVPIGLQLMVVLEKTLFFGVTVGDRTWVRIRYCGFSYPNPSTVTYGHPEISVK